MGGDIVEYEKILNSLKGISSILTTMSEVPNGGIQWNDFALLLLNKELQECIAKMEDME